jgi:photosystem II stability/assembly factor-like uncharacterized protein
VSCNKSTFDSAANDADQSSQMKKLVNISYGKLVELHNNIKSSVIKLNDHENLFAVYFVDEKNGWVGGEKKLYKTENGGANWIQCSFELPFEAKIKNIYFTNLTVGWILLQNKVEDITSYKENRFGVMQTMDGGKTWKLQYEAKEAVAARFFCDSNQSCWIAGTKYIGVRPVRFTYLLLHTTDSGNQWFNVSDSLKQVRANKKNKSMDELNEGVMGAYSDGNSSISVITSEREIFRTMDNGAGWRQIADLSNELPIIFIRNFGVKDNKHYWLAGTAHSMEGTFGTLTTEDSNNWNNYRLESTYFSDIVYLNKNDFLACGFTLAQDRKGDNQTERKEAVVLHTTDAGLTWNVVYRNSNIQAMNRIALFNIGTVWVVGENGLIIRLTL